MGVNMAKKMVSPENDLFSFSFCDQREVFEEKHLVSLVSLADPEKWTTKNGKPFDILFYYVIKTFEVLSKQNKISISNNEEAAIFNTGLTTSNGEDIFGFCTKNKFPNAQKWFFNGFLKSSSRTLSYYQFDYPKIASYDSFPLDLFFDVTQTIESDFDHIFDDHWDEQQERFPEDIKMLGKPLAIAAIKSAIDVCKIKMKRNSRLAVPQYYDGRIMFLLPIQIHVLNNKCVTMALAVEKNSNNSYRINTIFDLDTAYKKARLINKPESNWLIE